MSFVALGRCLVASNDVLAVFSLALGLLASPARVRALCCPTATASADSGTIMNAARAASGIGLGGQDCRRKQNETSQPYRDDTVHVGPSLLTAALAKPVQTNANNGREFTRERESNRTRLPLASSTTPLFRIGSCGSCVLRSVYFVLVCPSNGSLASDGCLPGSRA